MRAQEQRLGVFGLEVVFDERRPQPPARPQLGNLHVEIHPDAPEERQPGSTHRHTREVIQMRGILHKRYLYNHNLIKRQLDVSITNLHYVKIQSDFS